MSVYIKHKNRKENTVSFLLMFLTFAARQERMLQSVSQMGGISIYIFWGRRDQQLVLWESTQRLLEGKT
jgi:hypothetical protein